MHSAILCGGEGSRLRPLTYAVPKPLLPLGSKPILEVTITKMREQGFNKFYLMVNYKADMIRSYFGSGSSFGVEIEYYEEKEKRGTAGPLSQIGARINFPLLVLNADILTSLNFKKLIEFHNKTSADLTIALKQFERRIAYGVVEIDDESVITQLREKPTLNFLINSGIYVLSPSVMQLIPEQGIYAMTTLVEDSIAKNFKVRGYEFTDPWRDIGRLDDYMKALGDFENGTEPDTEGVFV